MVKIPFGWLPGHWGLSGHIREEARILYEISDPYEQELALIKLRYKTNQHNRDLEIVELDNRFGKFEDEYSYEETKLRLSIKAKFQDEDDEVKIKELNRGLNKLKLKYKKISELEYEKEMADIEDQPWVGVKNSTYDPKNGLGGLEFELDWNDSFIKFLNDNGYTGLTDQMTVEAWFNDLCKSVVAEEGLDEYVAALENISAKPFSGVQRVDLGDDHSEYS
jgi:hypothetical protein